MKKNLLYVVLGRNGKVSKKLIAYLKKESIRYISFPWVDIYSKRISYLLESIPHKNNYYKLVFIDCLIGSYDIKEEKNLHVGILQATKEIFPNSNYFYLSTFEPQIFNITEYRNMKLNLEREIIKNKGLIIRMGWPMNDNDEVLISKRLQILPRIIFTNLKFSPIYVPGTKIKDICNILAIENISKNIYKCYSYFLFIILDISFKPRLFFTPYKNAKISLLYELPIPVSLLKLLLSYLLKTLKFIKISPALIRLIEKPYSLLIQQDIIKRIN
tara:strand:+ start:910 stop:1725 length:816 start_codon:yes stop_codon:yes gene_type:complete